VEYLDHQGTYVIARSSAIVEEPRDSLSVEILSTAEQEYKNRI